MTIVDLVSSHLEAVSIIRDSEQVTNIQFADLFGASDTELVPIKIYFKGGTTKT